MQIISNLSDMIEEEMADAEKYIECAVKHKQDYPDLSAVFFKLSQDEITHANLLHEQVVAIITEYRKTTGEPSEKMQWVYDYLHKKHIDRANKIKFMQSLYKS